MAQIQAYDRLDAVADPTRFVLILEDAAAFVTSDGMLACRWPEEAFVGSNHDRILLDCEPFGANVSNLLVRATYADDCLPTALRAKQPIPVVAYWLKGASWTPTSALSAENGDVPVHGSFFATLASL